MKLEQVRYLLEINRLHSISAAARSLRVGQTTLSAIVKSVEEEVGFSIFQRTPNGVATTPTGAQFMALAWEIDVKYEELMAVKRCMAGGAPAITVLISPSIASCISLPLTARFSQFELNGNLVFDETQSQQVEERLLSNTGNIGLTYLTELEIQRIEKSIHHQSIHVERLMEDHLYLMVPKDHRFANCDSVSMKELSDERIASANRARNDKIVGTFLHRGERVTRFDSFDLMVQAVMQHQAAGIIPGLFALCAPVPGMAELRYIPLQNTEYENRMFLCLLTCKDRELRYQETILLTCIREFFQKLLDQTNPRDHLGEEEAQ